MTTQTRKGRRPYGRRPSLLSSRAFFCVYPLVDAKMLPIWRPAFCRSRYGKHCKVGLRAYSSAATSGVSASVASVSSISVSSISVSSISSSGTVTITVMPRRVVSSGVKVT